MLTRFSCDSLSPENLSSFELRPALSIQLLVELPGIKYPTCYGFLLRNRGSESKIRRSIADRINVGAACPLKPRPICSTITMTAEMQFLRARTLLLCACFAAMLPVAHAQTAAPANSSGANRNLQAADAAFRAGSEAYARNDLRTAHAEFAKLVRLAPGVAAGHSAFGTVLLAEGDVQAAATELELAHKLDPKDTTAILGLAMAYSQLREYEQSAAMFQLLAKLQSRAESKTGELHLSTQAVIAWASALAATAQPAAAQEKLEHALNTSPNDAALHDALGALLAQQQQYDKATSEFQRAIALDAALAPAHYHLGSVFLNQNDPPSAVKELRQASTLNPANIEYMLQFGRALRESGQVDAAIDVFRRATALDTASIDAKYELALALQASGNFQDALPLFQQVATARPKDPSALTNLGLTLVQTGNAKDAVPVYLHALDLDAQDATLREDLGVAYLQQSEFDQAIEQFRAGLSIDPDNANLHYDLGLALKLKDRPTDAIPELQAAETLSPQLPDPPYTLGVLYMQLGRFAESQAALEKATSLRPDYGNAWALLGDVYKQTDQRDKAIAALRKAIDLIPNQPGPHITLASILSEQGDRAGAAAERKKAAELTRVAVSHQRASFAIESGKLLLKRGQVAEAVAQFQTAVDADPSWAEAHLELANAFSQQGRTADAAIERGKAQELSTAAESGGSHP